MEWCSQLIAVYIKVCEFWESSACAAVQRRSHFQKYEITDQEIATIYLFGTIKKQFTIKNIFQYAKDHLQEWFPGLWGYDAFVHRLNQLGSAFSSLCEVFSHAINDAIGECSSMALDSMPIILANNKRSGIAKVAAEIADKGYSASKDTYYYGVKLHVLGFLRNKTIPTPEYLIVSKASDHDLSVFKSISSHVFNREIFADKAYCDENFSKTIDEDQNVKLILPVKKIKGQFSFEGGDAYSTAVSRTRQPIESFFNWVQEKTAIQMGSKIRSSKGLIVHIFGKLAATLMIMMKV